ncbi:heme peroxidase [Diplocarpon rosae]|nr:heme peroxidase [Diplocarpon rosae]
MTSLGTKYKYREADGSYNNIYNPQLGAANTPYARSAKPTILQTIALPDPAAIFDSLMVRGDTFEPHPNKISSMLFYLATIIIHDIFRTDHDDFNNSMTSSYLDLAPLYGSNQDEQNLMRTLKDGLLKPDCFSEKRLLGFPPGVGVFLIMFNRFHNNVVTQLAVINENGRFTKPKDGDPKENWDKYDNDLFQTGRLITCGLYVNVVLNDYVRTILSLNRTNTKWDLDPRTEEGKSILKKPIAEGLGNQVSAEFNLSLKKYSSFAEINPDLEVAEKLQSLYDHPDYVELYPGLVAEKAKPPMSPGSGLCVNFTTSYAILSDAVSLVRGDRFYTTDYTPKSLTNWGYSAVQSDKSVDDGCVLYKLILRAFPSHFEGNSIYAHFPFVVPRENLAIMKSLGRADKYSWDTPTGIPELIVIKSHAAAQKILQDKLNWKVTWGEAIVFMTSNAKRLSGVDFALAGDNPPNTASRIMMKKAIHPDNWHYEVKSFYEQTTAKLLRDYGFKVPGKSIYQVDIVRDVSNLVNARFAASLFSLPIKTEETPHGIYTEQEMYQVLSLCFICIFSNGDVTKSFQIREAAHMLAQQLGELILLNAEAVSATGFIADVLAKLHQTDALTEYGTHMIQRLLENNVPIKDVVWTHVLPTAASMTANQSQIFSQSLDYYLGDGVQYIPELYKLSKVNTKKADDMILRYFLEGARLRATVGLFRDFKPTSPGTTSVEIVDGSDTIIVPAGRRVFVDIIAASQDPAAFPNPTSVRLDRELSSYLQYGYGPHQCIGMDASLTAMTAMFKTVFGLKNLRRVQGSAPGGTWYKGGESQGELKKLPGPYGMTLYMTPDQSSIFPFPTTMKVQWDSE